MSWLQNKFEKNFLISTVDYVFNWARKSAVWPMTFGLACCAIEMIASSTARFDIARFGSEVFRPSPRQSDLMIVAGTVTLKMAPVVKRIYDQMPDPKWVISMGACSSVGGPFNTYAVLQGVDKIVPVDVYVTGCPPRPENLFYALLKLQDKIDHMTLAKRPTEVRREDEPSRRRGDTREHRTRRGELPSHRSVVGIERREPALRAVSRIQPLRCGTEPARPLRRHRRGIRHELHCRTPVDRADVECVERRMERRAIPLRSTEVPGTESRFRVPRERRLDVGTRRRRQLIEERHGARSHARPIDDREQSILVRRRGDLATRARSDER